MLILQNKAGGGRKGRGSAAGKVNRSRSGRAGGREAGGRAEDVRVSLACPSGRHNNR